MKRFIMLALPRIAVTAVLFFIAAALILYKAGKYEISFIPRDTAAPELISKDETRPGGNASPVQTTAPVTGDSISSVTDPGMLDTSGDETNPDDKKALQSSYNSYINSTGKYVELMAKGYSETRAAYNAFYHVLAIAEPEAEYQNVYSYRKETEEYTKRVATSLGYETQYKTREDYRPALKLYMGLVVADNGDGKFSLYDRTGRQIARSINLFYNVFDRDSEGNPLVRYGSKYYAVHSDGVFAETEYDPDYSPGVVYDAPYYYAKSDIKLFPYSQERVVYVMIETDERRNKTVTVLSNVPADEFEEFEQEVMAEVDIIKSAPRQANPAQTQPEIDPLTGKPNINEADTPVTEALDVPETTSPPKITENPPVFEYRTEKLWGFSDENDKVVIDAHFKAVYGFSDNGLAAVVGYNGELIFIDTSGRTVINPHGNVMYPAEIDNRRSYDGFYPADTKLPENIGMYYFDNGLVRVRRQIKDFYFKQRVAIDRDYLIDKNGAYFRVPENYNLIAYSDGVLTLEKDGLYGYYSYRGYWIAQPIYTVCKPFVQGLGVIGFNGGMCAMIDSEGNLVIPFVYNYISQPSDGVILAYSKTSGWTEFLTMAKPV